MIRPKRLPSVCLLWPLLAPVSASALTVEIQGVRLEMRIVGASCVEIAGSYPGVTVEPSQNGKTPRICYNSNKVNSITILDSTFIAAAPIQKDIALKFEHGFPPGINGKIMARAKIQGFFSTADGVGVPSGDKLSLTAFFSQSGHDDTIAEPFSMAVGDGMDSALFDYSAKEQYLISGPRTLKGVLTFSFAQAGHRLTLAEKSGIILDTGSTMADKLEALEPVEEDASPKTAPSPEDVPLEPPPDSPEGQKQDLPADQKAAPDASGKRKKALPKEQKSLPASPEKLDLPTELPAAPLPFTSPPGTGTTPSH